MCTVDFELWHLELITGLVVLVSLCRYLLLKTWPDFAESSEAANQQVAQHIPSPHPTHQEKKRILIKLATSYLSVIYHLYQWQTHFITTKSLCLLDTQPILVIQRKIAQILIELN